MWTFWRYRLNFTVPPFVERLIRVMLGVTFGRVIFADNAWLYFYWGSNGSSAMMIPASTRRDELWYWSKLLAFTILLFRWKVCLCFDWQDAQQHHPENHFSNSWANTNPLPGHRQTLPEALISQMDLFNVPASLCTTFKMCCGWSAHSQMFAYHLHTRHSFQVHAGWKVLNPTMELSAAYHVVRWKWKDLYQTTLQYVLEISNGFYSMSKHQV